MARRLNHDELLQLKRWNTPTIYNGWEQITRHDRMKGCRVREDALIHADKHGFLVIPEEDQKGLYEAACFMDANECRTIIGAARASSGKTHDQILQELNQAVEEFTRNAAEKYGRKGEL